MRTQAEDTNKVITLLALAEIPVKGTPFAPVDNRTVHADYAFQALRLAQRLHWAKGEAYGAMYASMAKEQIGELDQALVLLDSALVAAEDLGMQDRGVILQRTALVLAVRNIDFDKADSLTQLSLTCFRSCASLAQEGSGLELLARTQLIRQNWVAAIVAYTGTIRFCERNRLPMTLAIAHEKMGLIMATLGDVEKATRYYRASIHLCDSMGYGYRKYMGECNFGHLLIDNGLPEEAIPWLHAARSTVLSHDLSLSNLFVSDGLRAHALLMVDSVEAAGTLIAALRKMPHEEGSVLEYIEPIWLVKVNRPREAIGMLRAVYASSPKVGLRSDQVNRTVCEQLALAYRRLGQYANALAWTDSLRHWEQVLAYRGHVNAAYRAESEREIQDRLLADSLIHVNEKHELALASERSIAGEKSRRNGFLYAGLGMVVVAGSLWSRLRQTRRAKLAVEREKAVSEGLLLNILPAEVAQELKVKGYADAKHFDEATILFTDFKGFTSISEQLTARELVDELDTCFKAFDHIITARGIEKIKTIGDAYMCAGGLASTKGSSPLQVVLAALEMQDYMLQRKGERGVHGLPGFDMRLGIHTGPVVAGIVGVKKFQYDIWGDTVNIASRMESAGTVGEVNISEATYALVKEEPGISFTSRGKVLARGKGEMEMYFVHRVAARS